MKKKKWESNDMADDFSEAFQEQEYGFNEDEVQLLDELKSKKKEEY